MEPHEPAVAPAPIRGPWLAGYLLERQVVNATTLNPLGRISDVAIDAERGQLAGVTVRLGDDPRGLAALLRGAPRRRRRDGLATLDHIVALDGDVALVNAAPIRQKREAGPFEQMLFLNDICERAILTKTSRSLGILADVLLDSAGTLILGYVVQPTELAKEMLPLVGDVALSEARQAGADSGYIPPAAKMRLIPATWRVRFGPSVIMLVNEVEPLAPKIVVIEQEARERVATRGLFRRRR